MYALCPCLFTPDGIAGPWDNWDKRIGHAAQGGDVPRSGLVTQKGKHGERWGMTPDQVVYVISRRITKANAAAAAAVDGSSTRMDPALPTSRVAFGHASQRQQSADENLQLAFYGGATPLDLILKAVGGAPACSASEVCVTRGHDGCSRWMSAAHTVGLSMTPSTLFLGQIL